MENRLGISKFAVVLAWMCVFAPSCAAMAQFHDEQDYLRRKFREDVTDRTTGVGLDALKIEANRIVAAEKDRLPWCIVKAHKTSIRTRFQ